jgi:hypothetical protein
MRPVPCVHVSVAGSYLVQSAMDGVARTDTVECVLLCESVVSTSEGRACMHASDGVVSIVAVDCVP